MSKELPPEVAEFDKELYNLFDSRAVSASKIDKLTKLAFKAAKYYKNIVYCLEKFITRCVPEYKLTGLYVLDSICRTSQSVKTKSSSSSGSFSGAEYVARFEKNIEALFTEFTKVQEDKEKEKVKRVVDLWERSSTFAPSITESIRKKYFPLLEAKDDKKTSKTTNDTSTITATKEQENTTTSSTPETTTSSVANTASFISTLAASLAQTSGSSTPTSSGSSSNGYNLPWPSTPQPNTPTPPSLLSGISDPSSAQALQTILATAYQVQSATAPVATPHLVQPQPPFQSMYTPSFQSGALPPVLQQLQGMLSSSIEAPNNNNLVPTDASAYMYGGPGATTSTSTVGGGGGGGGGNPLNVFGVPGYPGSGRRDPRSDPRLRANGNEQPNGGSSQPPPGGSPSGFDNQALAQLAFLLKPQAQAQLPPQAQGPPGPPMELPKSDEPMGMNMHPARLGLLQGATMGQGYRGTTGGPGAPQGPREGSSRPLPTTNNNNNNIDHDHPSDRSTRQQPYQRHPLPPNPMLAQAGARPKGIEVREDPQVGPDQIRVISRTLWVGGGFIPTISVPDLEAIFAPKGQIATCMINQAKFNAFIKMADRAQAERCKAELDRTTVQGDVMKVGWGCGFGPRDCFDYTSGTSLIPLDRLTDTDRRWLSNSVVGGFGPHEVIRGGVVIFEPNIEALEADGREALPRKSRGFGGANLTGIGRGGGDMGRGRGRGRGMDSHGSEFTSSFRGGGRGGHRGGHQGFDSQAGTTTSGGKRDFEHKGDQPASVPPTAEQEERRDAKKTRWG